MNPNNFHSNKSLLYISVYDPHVPLTGGAIRGGEFVNNLAGFFDLDLVYLDGAGQPPISALLRQYSSSLKGIRRKRRIGFSRTGYFIFSGHLYRQAKEFLKQNRYDAILCDYGLSGIYGIMLSSQFSLPLIYCSHNIEHLQYLGKAKHDKRRYLIYPYVYWVERQAVKVSTILVPISNSDAEYYIRWTERDKMLVIPQGFDEAVFNPYYNTFDNDPKLVLFCGNFGIETNREVVQIIMDYILPRVLRECPRTRFLLVGANPPKGVGHPNVHFTGFIDEYPALLQRVDVVISPIQRGWGFPTKVIEALACGKPIIATPVGARAVERDYKALTIAELGQFPEKICEVIRSNRSRIPDDFDVLRTRYSWSKNIKKLADRIDSEL